MLGRLLRKEIENALLSTLMPLYKSMEQPCLECRVQFWRFHLKKDTAELEKEQKRAPKMVRECWNL